MGKRALDDGRIAVDQDPTVDKLLATASVVVVPNLNPDGGKRGALRVNAAGSNLNRCWGSFHGLAAPGHTEEQAPETAAIKRTMQALGGPDLMLDIHQDEEKAYAFISKTPF